MGNFWFALSTYDIRADVEPARGFAKVLGEVGNALAEEIGLPKPGSVEEATDTITSAKGWIFDETKEYYGLREKYWKLRNRVVEEEMGMAFESDPEKEITKGEVGKGLLTEVTKVEDVLFGLAKKYSRKHSFRVNGYRSSGKALMKHIDQLTDDSHIEQVKAAVDDYEHGGREGLIDILVDKLAAYKAEFAKKRLNTESPAFIAYSTAQHWPTNVERVFGLDFEGPLRETLRNEIENRRAGFYQKKSSA